MWLPCYRVLAALHMPMNAVFLRPGERGILAETWRGEVTNHIVTESGIGFQLQVCWLWLSALLLHYTYVYWKWHLMNSNLKRPRYIYHKPQFTASLPHLFLKERLLQLLERQEAEDFDMVFFFFLIPEINICCGSGKWWRRVHNKGKPWLFPE